MQNLTAKIANAVYIRYKCVRWYYKTFLCICVVILCIFNLFQLGRKQTNVKHKLNLSTYFGARYQKVPAILVSVECFPFSEARRTNPKSATLARISSSSIIMDSLRSLWIKLSRAKAKPCKYSTPLATSKAIINLLDQSSGFSPSLFQLKRCLAHVSTQFLHFPGKFRRGKFFID